MPSDSYKMPSASYTIRILPPGHARAMEMLVKLANGEYCRWSPTYFAAHVNHALSRPGPRFVKAGKKVIICRPCVNYERK
jgi:hypothetical protein